MADRYIPEHRRTNFKAKSTFKPEELRRRREEQQVEIRKAKREENLAKRRGIGSGENRPGASLGAAPDSDDDTAPTESQVSFASSFLATFRPLILLCLNPANTVAPFVLFPPPPVARAPCRCPTSLLARVGPSLSLCSLKLARRARTELCFITSYSSSIYSKLPC